MTAEAIGIIVRLTAIALGKFLTVESVGLHSLSRRCRQHRWRHYYARIALSHPTRQRARSPWAQLRKQTPLAAPGNASGRNGATAPNYMAQSIETAANNPDSNHSRLVLVQHGLIDLIDLLDPDRVRIPQEQRTNQFRAKDLTERRAPWKEEFKDERRKVTSEYKPSLLSLRGAQKYRFLFKKSDQSCLELVGTDLRGAWFVEANLLRHLVACLAKVLQTVSLFFKTPAVDGCML